ncbi:hypothetical protein ACSQ67_018361 [Phaseolus vulgaris]
MSWCLGGRQPNCLLTLLQDLLRRNVKMTVLASPVSRDQKEEPINATPKLISLSTRQFHSPLTSPYSFPTLFLHSSQIGVAVRRYFLRAVEYPKCIAAGDSRALRSRSKIRGRFDGIRELFVSVLVLS